MPVADQAWTLLAAGFLGAALALVFDALRALRRRVRPLGRGGLDVLFALFTLAALFTFGMVTPLGRLQLPSLAAVAVGALAYGVWLRPVFFPVFDHTARLLAKLAKWCGNHLKKVHFFCKKLFFLAVCAVCFVVPVYCGIKSCYCRQILRATFISFW